MPFTKSSCSVASLSGAEAQERTRGRSRDNGHSHAHALGRGPASSQRGVNNPMRRSQVPVGFTASAAFAALGGLSGAILTHFSNRRSTALLRQSIMSSVAGAAPTTIASYTSSSTGSLSNSSGNLPPLSEGPAPLVSQCRSHSSYMLLVSLHNSSGDVLRVCRDGGDVGLSFISQPAAEGRDDIPTIPRHGLFLMLLEGSNQKVCKLMPVWEGFGSALVTVKAKRDKSISLQLQSLRASSETARCSGHELIQSWVLDDGMVCAYAGNGHISLIFREVSLLPSSHLKQLQHRISAKFVSEQATLEGLVEELRGQLGDLQQQAAQLQTDLVASVEDVAAARDSEADLSRQVEALKGIKADQEANMAILNQTLKNTYDRLMANELLHRSTEAAAAKSFAGREAALLEDLQRKDKQITSLEQNVSDLEAELMQATAGRLGAPAADDCIAPMVHGLARCESQSQVVLTQHQQLSPVPAVRNPQAGGQAYCVTPGMPCVSVSPDVTGIGQRRAAAHDTLREPYQGDLPIGDLPTEDLPTEDNSDWVEGDQETYAGPVVSGSPDVTAVGQRCMDVEEGLRESHQSNSHHFQHGEAASGDEMEEDGVETSQLGSRAESVDNDTDNGSSYMTEDMDDNTINDRAEEMGDNADIDTNYLAEAGMDEGLNQSLAPGSMLLADFRQLRTMSSAGGAPRHGHRGMAHQQWGHSLGSSDEEEDDHEDENRRDEGERRDQRRKMMLRAAHTAELKPLGTRKEVLRGHGFEFGGEEASGLKVHEANLADEYVEEEEEGLEEGLEEEASHLCDVSLDAGLDAEQWEIEGRPAVAKVFPTTYHDSINSSCGSGGDGSMLKHSIHAGIAAPCKLQSQPADQNEAVRGGSVKLSPAPKVGARVAAMIATLSKASRP